MQTAFKRVSGDVPRSETLKQVLEENSSVTSAGGKKQDETNLCLLCFDIVLNVHQEFRFSFRVEPRCLIQFLLRVKS